MNEAGFDKFKDGYLSHLETGPYKSLCGKSHKYFISVKAQELLAASKNLVSSARVVLDVGCGIGLAEKYLSPHFSVLVGCDISGGMLKEAAGYSLPNVTFIQCSGFNLPFTDRSVDILFSVSLFHHVSKDLHSSLILEMKRVLRDGGLLVVFEHNPYNPLTRYIVRTCEVDMDARLVPSRWIRHVMAQAGLRLPRNKFIIFFPKWLSFLRSLEGFFGWLPLGTQYMVSALR